MIINNYFPVKSSFLSVEKDMNIIIKRLMANPRLKRLLYYNSKDALNRPDLTEEQSIELINNHIRIVPKLPVEKEAKSYIYIRFNNFFPNATNPEFRNNEIEFDIICHQDQWQLNDLALRPYRIAAEIDTLMDDTRLTGIGKLEYVCTVPIMLTDGFYGLCMKYLAIHGEEDKKQMLNPVEQEQLEKDFTNMLNELQ